MSRTLGARNKPVQYDLFEGVSPLAVEPEPALRVACSGGCGRWWYYEPRRCGKHPGGRPRRWCDFCYPEHRRAIARKTSSLHFGARKKRPRDPLAGQLALFPADSPDSPGLARDSSPTPCSPAQVA